MGRQRRIDFDGGYYHVMNRGVARQPTFFGDEDRVEFGRLLGVGYERFAVEVHAYCLMTNHYHLLLRCPDAGLSRYMQQLSSVFTRHVNDRADRDGPLFRGRFHSIPIETQNHFLRGVRYIHRNALDLPEVSRPDRYRWSSHRSYLGHRQLPIWLRTDLALASFGHDAAAFDRFVSHEPCIDAKELDVAVVEAVAELVLEECEDQLETARQGVRRTVMVLLLDRLPPGPPRERLATILEFPNGRAQQSAMSRARRRAAANPRLQLVVDRVMQLAA